MVKARREVSIVFLPDEFVVEVSQKDENLLESALRAGFPLDHSCGGNGTCTTCRVIVEEGAEYLEPRNEIEQEMADDRNFAVNERLSCQIKPTGPMRLRVPHKND